MKHYKDLNNNIYAYELDGSQDHLVGDKTPITDEEANNILSQNRASAFDILPYTQKRQSEYPSIGDQLDALWKGGDTAAEMLAIIQSVKVKYPKV